jgi:hypothetical protein
MRHNQQPGEARVAPLRPSMAQTAPQVVDPYGLCPQLGPTRGLRLGTWNVGPHITNNNIDDIAQYAHTHTPQLIALQETGGGRTPYFLLRQILPNYTIYSGLIEADRIPERENQVMLLIHQTLVPRVMAIHHPPLPNMRGRAIGITLGLSERRGLRLVAIYGHSDPTDKELMAAQLIEWAISIVTKPPTYGWDWAGLIVGDLNFTPCPQDRQHRSLGITTHVPRSLVEDRLAKLLQSRGLVDLAPTLEAAVSPTYYRPTPEYTIMTRLDHYWLLPSASLSIGSPHLGHSPIC